MGKLAEAKPANIVGAMARIASAINRHTSHVEQPKGLHKLYSLLSRAKLRNFMQHHIAKGILKTACKAGSIE